MYRIIIQRNTVYIKRIIRAVFFCACIFSVFVLSCNKEPFDDGIPNDPPSDTTENPPEDTFDINSITDTYYDLHFFNLVMEWGPYNVHDPSVIDDGEYFYSYSTDVMYGLDIVRSGIQVRKSKDLVEWKFVGWAFPGRPQQAVNYIIQNGSTPVDNVWAPYIMKVGDAYRLYYSQASEKVKLSVIGLGTASSPLGPWTEQGLVVTSSDNIVMPNAIDPSVIIDKNGRHWMFYGSSWDGIYILELDPETGLAKIPNTKGRRIAHRGFTSNVMNGNIEAPEIIYHPDFNKYYLFISYDWLSTKYNVRVGRADNPDGPYYDYNGIDMNGYQDNIPMIIAPYAFQEHGGWQGTGHCAVFQRDGQFFIAHQGRPAVSKYYMVLHVRKILWTEEGWPVVSPERYAGIAKDTVTNVELSGKWEYIVFNYRVVPGFENEQVIPDIQFAGSIILDAEGTISSNPENKWTFDGKYLELDWNALTIDKVIVEKGWDWERQKETWLFTGLNNKGITIWGKKSN